MVQKILLAPDARPRSHFAAALARILQDVGLSEPIVRLESAAVEFEPLARLTNRSMTGTLDDLEFHCGIECRITTTCGSCNEI